MFVTVFGKRRRTAPSREAWQPRGATIPGVGHLRQRWASRYRERPPVPALVPSPHVLSLRACPECRGAPLVEDDSAEPVRVTPAVLPPPRSGSAIRLDQRTRSRVGPRVRAAIGGSCRGALATNDEVSSRAPSFRHPQGSMFGIAEPFGDPVGLTPHRIRGWPGAVAGSPQYTTRPASVSEMYGSDQRITVHLRVRWPTPNLIGRSRHIMRRFLTTTTAVAGMALVTTLFGSAPEAAARRTRAASAAARKGPWPRRRPRRTRAWPCPARRMARTKAVGTPATWS